MHDIETKLYCRGDLVHVLPAVARCTDEGLVDFVLVDRDIIRNGNSSLLVTQVAFLPVISMTEDETLSSILLTCASSAVPPP